MTAFPEVSVEKLTNDCDFIIVACDGIWDCMSSQECCNFVSSRLKTKKGKESVVEVVKELFDNIVATDVRNSGGIGCDNMTCIVIEIKK